MVDPTHTEGDKRMYRRHQIIFKETYRVVRGHTSKDSMFLCYGHLL